MTENILNSISDLVNKSVKNGADRADAISFASADVSLSVRLGELETIERSESQGIGLRVMIGKRKAIVSTTNTSKESLNELIERAIDMAKLSPEDPYADIANDTQLAKNIQDLDLFDKNEPTEESLKQMAYKAEEAARSVKGITNSEGADASYSKNTIMLVTSNGFAHSYRTSSSSLSVSVLAGEGTSMERDYDYTVARFGEDLESPEKTGKTAADKAIKRLNAKRIKSGQMPVVFDPRVSKNLVSTLASAANGASIAKGSSFLKEKFGKQIFKSGINIINDNHIVRGLASKPFDAEGVSGGKINLIKDGNLTNWLLDIRSANQLKLKTNGNASRGISSNPFPSSGNLYMQNGNLSPEELISDIKKGLYITEIFGMGINLTTGDYSQGASGFYIENGQITYAVSEITIAGSLSDIFLNLTPANDLEFRYGTNCPTVRIDLMTVAGV